MIGRTLGHYRIVEKVGAGGMGEVYRAWDGHLERDVAVKVLPSGLLADDAARKRFRNEALALSKLNHPNIETVHEFDTQDGVDFLVMEYISGETLDHKLRAGPLPEKEVLRLGLQLAEALTAAHGEGVVHRDLKPANLRITPESRLKVLDFGLAKLARPAVADAATAESLFQTQRGAAAGTLPYMAPEQLRGEKADARTDLWSAGVVLYEMATGRRPFEAQLVTALAADIQHQPPRAPLELNPNLSLRLQEVILKCLEKDPENRYQSAKELVVDLRRLSVPATTSVAPEARAQAWTVKQALAGAAIGGVMLVAVMIAFNLGGWRERLVGGAGPPKIQSLAVLPLENLSHDPEQEYFADGMTDALITDLAQIASLKVISRTSVMPYKGAKKPLPQIARELGVDAVVEGSVQRSGDRVRITAQLIHAPTDRHLWAESYERQLRDVLALEGEVARAIANEIKIKITPEEQVRLARARPVNPEAHEAYLKGRYYWNKRTGETLQKATGLFQQAIEMDPTYAPAYAGLAQCYDVLPTHADAAPMEVFPKAKAAAAKALEIDETLAEAHTALAYALDSYDWDWNRAGREYRRAIELNPGNADVHHWYALHLAFLGRINESIVEIKRAQELDPLSLIINANVGRMLANARRYDEAIVQYRKTLELDPNFEYAHFALGSAYRHRGRYEDAIQELQKSVSLSSGTPNRLAALAAAYAASGKRAEALKILERLKERPNARQVSPGAIATIYIGLGEKDQALAWLEKAYEDRSAGGYFLKLDPGFDSLRSDPRFQDLLRRMNLPQ